MGTNIYLKGIDFIINVISQIPTINQPKSKIVTCKYKKNKLQNFLKHKKLTKFKILTNVRGKKLINLYRKTKLLLYFPRKEPFGLISLEALSQGCPTLAINEGGFTEVAKKARILNFYLKTRCY